MLLLEAEGFTGFIINFFFIKSYSFVSLEINLTPLLSQEGFTGYDILFCWNNKNMVIIFFLV
jgi:hypothetical protein